ncbi:MAG: hypothetical protein JNL67_22455 [Planctomycetaceae bacterium]|nr:hypothetical protein [Planctomycetaceae bacterium]
MQVQSISPPAPVQIDCDGYIPLSIRVNGNSSWPPKYWRTGDFKHSLVEVGVDPSTGAICKIVVTSIRDISTESQMAREISGQQTNGVPNALLSFWGADQTRVDVEGSVHGYLDGHTFTIVLGDEQDACKVVACDRVKFLLNSNDELCGFQVVDLADQDIENLRYAIGI